MTTEIDLKFISDYRDSIADFTVEELEEELGRLQDGISKMILDSDLVLKSAIVQGLLEKKKAND